MCEAETITLARCLASQLHIFWVLVEVFIFFVAVVAAIVVVAPDLDDGDDDDDDDDDLEKTYEGQKDAGNEAEWVSSGETRGLVQRQ